MILDVETLCNKLYGTAPKFPNITDTFNIKRKDHSNDKMGGSNTFKTRNFIPFPCLLLKYLWGVIFYHKGDIN